MPYNGSGINPYWATVASDGSHNGAGMVSENIQVTPGASISFTATAAYETSYTNAAGAAILTLEFYTAGGASISSLTQAFPNTMTGGAQYTASLSGTVPLSPTPAAYAQAFVSQPATGTSPTANNLLQVYTAKIAQGNVPINANYAFTYSYYPWAPTNEPTSPTTTANIGWAFSPLIANDFDSLVIDNSIELMGGAPGVSSPLPGLLDSNGVGPRFRILAPPSLNSAAYGYEESYDLNAPQPTQDVVASMLLDGERPFGTRASNRTITLPVIIFGTQAGGMTQVYAAMEYLMQTIDQQVYTIKWTSADTGLPMLFDCFRALPSQPLYGFNYSAGGSATNSSVGRPNAPMGLITLSIQAMPYGRSDIDGVQTLQFANPLVGGNPGGSPVTIDTFTSVSQANWIQDTLHTVAAGDSAHYIAPVPLKSPWPAAVYSKTLGSSVDIVGITNLSVQFGQAYDTQWPQWAAFQSNVTLDWTLTDVNGKTLSFNVAAKNVTWGATPSTPKWTQLNAPIPQGVLNFAYDQVTAYSVSISNWTGSGQTGYVRMHCWLNGLVANPQTIANATSPRGVVYNCFGLTGTARSQISVQCQLPAEKNTVQEITGPGTGSWLVPPNVYQLEAEVWGGGGAGATCDLARVIGGAGGAGAEYAAEPVLYVTPGQAVPYSIGTGGLAAQVIPTVIQFTNPGLSHWTCPVGVTTLKVEVWGSGAAGAAGSGGGGGGEYAQEPTMAAGTYNGQVFPGLVAGTTYNIWVADGGRADTGTTSADRLARSGENSWFGPPSCQLSTKAYVWATGGISPATGATNGGGGGGTSTGANGHSNNTYHANGGAGGASPGAAGGGGGGAAGFNNTTTLAARGGTGGDSPASSAYGRWQGSGAAGAGAGTTTSVGGNGGAGAPVPGFPVTGVAPGGGGGGGYSGPKLSSTIQPATETLGQATVSYIGANGAPGMVQLSYEVGGGNPVNGGNTTFGSAATTTTTVIAHGGTSAPLNSAVGAIGASGSSNTVHTNGGNGGYYVNGPQGAYIGTPRGTQFNTPVYTFQSLSSLAYTTATGTTGTAASSCAQGVGIAVVESVAPVTDLYVSDSAGNIYVPQNSQSALGATGATVYTFVSNLQYPITTATTLTVTSATAQQYGVLWYASPWLTGGITSPNNGNNHGTGSTASGTFGTGDSSTLQYELVVAVADGSATFTQASMTYYDRLWYNAGSTNTLAAGALNMAAWVGVNQGGGNQVNTGDTLTVPLSGSADWAVISIPLIAANQAQTVVQMDWRTGATPGAQTTWINSASIDSQGLIAIVGMCGSGASITAGPSAVHDASGNVYTKQAQVQLPSNGGTMWAYTAPVTAGLAQGVTGTINWGTVSAAPDYWASMYWLPNVSAGAPVTAGATGSNSTPSAVYTPASGAPDQVLLTLFGNAASAALTSGPPVTGGTNQVDQQSQAYLNGTVYATQIVDTASVTAAGTYGTTEPWGMLQLGFIPNSLFSPDASLGQGGGAAGGPTGPGYPATFNYGGPGYAGGGKGGSGAAAVNSQGGGAALPGGGGGGAWSNSTTAQAGGTGGGGLIRLTWQPPLKAFNTLVIHKPGDDASASLSPICPIPITDTPNNTEYTVPSLVPGVNAVFNSTYTILLANNYWDSPENSRQVTVTINQYEYVGGPKSSVQATRAMTPATDIVNGVCNMGEVTLPIKDYAQHNDQSYFTVSINDTDTNDRFMDVLFLDTQGTTIITNVAPGTQGYGTYVNFYVDEAPVNKDLGFIGATVMDRQHQVSILDFTSVNGGPLYVKPGDNMITVWSPSGPPNLGVTYAPRWFLNRTK